MERLSASTKRSPVTTLLGPRQCGKTTLARMFAEGKNAIYFDLESQGFIALAVCSLMLGYFERNCYLDEIQEMPGLFNVLRVLVDCLRTGQ